MLSFNVFTKLCCSVFSCTLVGLQQVAVEIHNAKRISINKTSPVNKRPIFQFDFHSVTQHKQTLYVIVNTLSKTGETLTIKQRND